MTNILIFTGTALTTASFVPYLRDIIRHGARPRLVSWVIWSLLLGLMATVSVQERQWESALVAAVSSLGCLLVVGLGWRYASRGVTSLEKGTLIAALAGIALWFTLDNSLIVLIVALGIDALAYIPTIIHGWTDPEEESWQAYLLGAVGEGLVLCAALFQHASLVGILYPLYAATFGFAMVGIVLFSRWWYGAGEDGVLETY